MKIEFDYYLALVLDLVNTDSVGVDEKALVKSYWREDASVEVAADALCDYMGSFSDDSEMDEDNDFGVEYY